MAKNNYAIEVKDVKKSFFLPHYRNDSFKRAITQAFKKKDKGGNTFNALNGVSFNVDKGDFFGILGRNGSGKSTLLKIISEIYQPTAGSVKHDGKLVSFIELGVGFKQDLTGRENVFLNGALLGFSKKEIEEMYDDIVEFAELEKFMDQRLKNYSSGMKVRLAFSVAIRAKADILILDEVLAVGDAAFQKKCTDYFETLKHDGKTVILVTHSMGNVRRFCSKAIVIDNGKVVFSGGADDAADEYDKLFETNKKSKLDRLGTGDVRMAGAPLINVDSKTISIDVLLKPSIDSEVYLAVDFYRDGALVCGFSTKDIERIFKCTQGEDHSVKIDMDNILGGGDYSVAMSVRDYNSDEIYDFWRTAQKFSNKFNSNRYLPIRMPIEISVEK